MHQQPQRQLLVGRARAPDLHQLLTSRLCIFTVEWARRLQAPVHGSELGRDAEDTPEATFQDVVG
eukprot:1872696-Alexandrium_andersonii.AAC.1